MNPIQEQEAAKGLKVFTILENVLAEVSEYQGKTRIDLRKWYQDSKTELFARSKKGLNLELADWNDFVAKIEEVDEFVQANKW